MKFFIKYVVLRVIRTTPLGHLKNLDFLDFQSSYLIWMEKENVIYLKKNVRDRAILGNVWTPRIFRGPGY